SYMMSLIYGLLSLKLFLLNGMQIDRNMSNYNQMKNWLKDLLDAPQKEIILTEDRYNDLLGLLNEILNYNKLIIMHTIFNANVDIESLEVLIPYYEKISIVKSKEVEGEEFVNFVTIKIGDKKRETIRIKEEQLKEEQTQDLLLIFIAEMILGTPLQEPSIYKPCYLPTSRTGFLLTYKTLAERSLSDKFNVEKSTKNLLTRPSSDFLTNLSMLTARDFNYEYKEIIEFIEDDILEGRVDAQELPASDFIYIPKGTKDSIPMFISSGVVTEITPLLLLLKHKKNISMLMMEEPEMCLHPKLQWSITRALIQLSNMNMPVIITTH
ncbi:MAG: hypothetical protein RR582_09855, partial [Niameybacter sp.]